MATLTDIKYKIDQLDGGTFQALCDAYLSKKGYKNIVTLGMKSGTHKTTRGIPDTYFSEQDGKYILVMYTAQITGDVYSKIKTDLEDAMDKEKTGLDISDILEIVYCHTSSNLSAGKDKALKEMCNEKNILLTILGIDTLAQELYSHYHLLAKDFLGVSINTGQIMEIADFIDNYNRNKLAAPIDTPFQFRVNELTNILETIADNKLIILTGKAGVGKTRLALEVIEEYKKGFEGKIYCVSSNGLPIYEDVKDFLAYPSKYLFFIDDANQLTGIHHLMDYINKPDYDIKIVCTVRDYAKQFLAEKTREFTTPKTIEIGIFSDTEIKELIEKILGITNNEYLEQIVRIAEGNARIAILAGKLAIEKQNLSVIRDVSELYENYYSKFLKENNILKTDRKLCAVAGITAFLGALHLDRLEGIIPILDSLEISLAQFKENILHLHELEILDVCNDKAVKFSEQSLSNYFIKYVFIDRKIVSLELIIEQCFINYKERVINAVNILGGIFSSDSVNSEVFKAATNIWEKWKLENNPHFFEFVKVFYQINLVDTLLMIKADIDIEKDVDFDLDTLDFEKKKNNQTVDNENLKILGGYADTEYLEEALDIFFIYLKKRPDLYMDFYHTANQYFGIKKISHKFDYYTQVKFYNKMFEYSDDWTNPIICRLLFDSSKEFLKVVHHPVEGGRNNTISYYTIPVVLSDGSKEYRKTVWNALSSMSTNTQYKANVTSIIEEYSPSRLDEIEKDIIQYDWKFIKTIIEIFDADSIKDCIILEKIKERLDWFQIIDTSYLNTYFNNDKFMIYELLKGKRQLEEFDWEKERELKKQAIVEFMADKNLSDIMRIIDLCAEIGVDPKSGWSNLSEGLMIVFQSIMNNEKLFTKALDYYLMQDTPLNLYPEQLIQKLFEDSNTENVFKFINQYNYSFKTTWKYCFYKNIPPEKIENKHVSEWYEYLKEDFLLTNSSLRSLDFLKDYEKFEKDVLPKSCEIILNQAKETPFLIVIYFGFLFNDHITTPDELLVRFENHLPLLQDIYLIALEQKDNSDYKGSFFLALIERDFDFIYRYLSLLLDKKVRRHDLEKNTIKSVWLLDDYIEKIDLVVNYIFDNTEHIFFSFPQNELDVLLSNDSEDSLVLKQDEWISHYIDIYNDDADRMKFLFSAISSYPKDRRKRHIITFAKVNKAFLAFKNIPLEPSNCGGTGSMIPYIQERIDFLESLMEAFKGIDYLAHKKYIVEYIEIWKRRIENEQIEEMIRGY